MSAAAPIEELIADLRAQEGDFRGCWRTLGRHGAFSLFARPDTLQRGCEWLEQLAYHHDDLGFFLSVISGCGLALPIVAMQEEQPAWSELTERVLAGEWVVAVAITEPTAGSDALSLAARLRKQDDRLLLSGRKWNITNAPVADRLIIFCWDETGPQRMLRAVVVPRQHAGVSTSVQTLIGCHGSPTGEIHLQDVEIAPEWVLPSDGKTLLDLAFARERALAPWPLVGKMARVIQEAIDHIDKREQFGKPIKSFQYVQDKIVRSYELLQTARLLAQQAVDEIAAGSLGHARASLAKYVATDHAVEVFRMVMECFGSYGLQEQARLGRYLADAVCATVAGGTREMHKRVIFDQLLLDRARARRRGRSRCFHVTSTSQS